MISRHGIPSISDSKIAYAQQLANLVLAGPTSGGAGAVVWRNLVAGDIPGTINALLSIPSTTDTDPAIIDLPNAPSVNHRILSGKRGSANWKCDFNVTSSGTFEIVYNATYSGGVWNRTDGSYSAYRYEFTAFGEIIIQTKPSGSTWSNWDTTTTLNSNGRIVSPGAIRAYGGVCCYIQNGQIIGYGLNYGKDFGFYPSSFTQISPQYNLCSIGFFTYNATTNGIGIYHFATGTGNGYIWEEFQVS